MIDAEDRADFYYEVSSGEESADGHIWASESELIEVRAEMQRILPYMEFTFFQTLPECEYAIDAAITPMMVASDMLLNEGFIDEPVHPGPYIHYHLDGTSDGAIAHPGLKCRGCK